MASDWTVELMSAAKTDFGVSVVLRYTSASQGLQFTETVPGDFTTDMTRLALWAKDKIKLLDKRDATFGTLAPGVIVVPKDYGAP